MAVDATPDSQPPRADSVAALAALISSFGSLRRVREDNFCASVATEGMDRVYGGRSSAQALAAASSTVSADRLVHSVKVTFLAQGNPALPMEYEVIRLRDSSNFSTRAVTAYQGDARIATIIASFQVPVSGIEHSVRPDAFDSLPRPDALPERERLIAESFVTAPLSARQPWPVDIRYADHAPWQVPAGEQFGHNRLWMRAAAPVVDDPVVSACLLTYASDLIMVDPVVHPHRGSPHNLTWEAVANGEIRGASLDHSIWFHRPFRFDNWLLIEQESAIAHGSRGFSTARIFSSDGTLFASITQEVVLFVGS